MSENRPPVPDPLRLVEEFVNTMDVETNQERDFVPENLATGWTPRLYPAYEDVSRAVAARDLRALLSGDAATAADPEAIEALNAALAPVSVRFDAGGARLEAHGDGLDALLQDIFQAAVPGHGRRYVAPAQGVRSDDCRWAFYDRSNRSGHSARRSWPCAKPRRSAPTGRATPSLGSLQDLPTLQRRLMMS